MCKNTMLDQRAYIFSTQLLAEAHVIVVFVGGETE